jgi:hypothetical protein
MPTTQTPGSGTVTQAFNQGKQNHRNPPQQTLSTMVSPTGYTLANKTKDNNIAPNTNHDVTNVINNNNNKLATPSLDKSYHTQSLANISMDAGKIKSKIPDKSQPEMDKEQKLPAKPSHTTNKAPSQTYANDATLETTTACTQPKQYPQAPNSEHPHSFLTTSDPLTKFLEPTGASTTGNSYSEHYDSYMAKYSEYNTTITNMEDCFCFLL